MSKERAAASSRPRRTTPADPPPGAAHLKEDDLVTRIDQRLERGDHALRGALAHENLGGRVQHAAKERAVRGGQRLTQPRQALHRRVLVQGVDMDRRRCGVLDIGRRWEVGEALPQVDWRSGERTRRPVPRRT